MKKQRLKVGDYITHKNIMLSDPYILTNIDSVCEVIKILGEEEEDYNTVIENISVKIKIQLEKKKSIGSEFNVNSYCFRKITKKEIVALMI